MKNPARCAAAVGVGLAGAAFFLGWAEGAEANLLPVRFEGPLWGLLVVAFGLLAGFAAHAFRRSIRRQSQEQLHLQSQMLAQVNDAVVAIDNSGRVIFWGRGAEAQYGVAADDALGKPVRDLYRWRWHTPHDEPAAYASLAAKGFWRGENIHVLPSGREIEVETAVTLLRDSRGVQTGKIAVIRDISERKKIERERDANESRLRLALDHVDVAVFNQDRDLRYTWIYKPQLVTADEVLGKTDYDLLEKLRLTGFEKVIALKRRVLETGVGAREEVRFDTGAEPSWYELSIEPIRDESGAVAGINAASINLTDRRRGEARLRALFARLQSIREEERTRIARDLHDELGQLLTALKLQLCSLEKKVGRNGNGILDRLVASSSLIDQTLTTVRRIAFELRPSTLDQLGLVPTLREEIRRFEDRTGIHCKARLPEQLPDLGSERTTALYRIFQEALTNVSRHAGASRLAVRLEVSPYRITLECEDDGTGFDASSVESPLALGLAGMVERARALEGEVRFERGPKRGTIVIASLPLAREVRS